MIKRLIKWFNSGSTQGNTGNTPNVSPSDSVFSDVPLDITCTPAQIDAGKLYLSSSHFRETEVLGSSSENWGHWGDK